MIFNVNGASAYAYTGGKPFNAALPTVVFIHGACHDHSAWTLLARWCAHHGFSALAVDLPGHARSGGPLCQSVEEMAAWLLKLLSAAGVQQATLVGHSMGSLVAMQAAASGDTRIKGIVMIGTTYPMNVSEALLSTAREAPDKAMQMVNAWSISSHATKPGFPGPGQWLHGGNLALMRRVQAASSANLFHTDFAACNAYRAGEDAAVKVACPVTMVLGHQDQMTPARSAQTLATALRAKVAYTDSGHHLMGETPDATLAALRGALGA